MNDEPGRRRKWRVLLLLGIALLLPAILIAARRTLYAHSRAKYERDRQLCRWNLWGILNWQVNHRYLPEHGTFPPDLKTAWWEAEMSLAPGSPSCGIFLKCPGSGTKMGPLADAEQWQDYIYIDWSRYYDDPETVPPDYPMIYDRRLSNHNGKGIHVLSVEAALYWDPDAGALKEFAAEHPEYEVPLPE